MRDPKPYKLNKSRTISKQELFLRWYLKKCLHPPALQNWYTVPYTQTSIMTNFTIAVEEIFESDQSFWKQIIAVYFYITQGGHNKDIGVLVIIEAVKDCHKMK